MHNLQWINIEPNGIPSLPMSECVYRIETNFHVLYIGQSVKLRTRFLQHKNFISILVSKYGDVSISYAETENSRKVEKELIEKYNPLHNGICRKKKISDLVESIKILLDGRRLNWLSNLINTPLYDVSKKMSGKSYFTQFEIDAINNRFNSNLKLDGADLK